MARGKGQHSAVRKRAVRAGFRSALEQRFARLNPDLIYEPESFPYCREQKLVTDITGQIVLERKDITRTYTPDFVSPDGKTWFEIKGRLDADDRKRMRAVKASYPNVRIVMVFQRPNQKCTKAAKSKTYAEWAERYGLEVMGLSQFKEA